MTVPNWDFYGSTMVTSNFIRLTADAQSQRGSLWNQYVSYDTLLFVYSTVLFVFLKHIFFYLRNNSQSCQETGI